MMDSFVWLLSGTVFIGVVGCGVNPGDTSSTGADAGPSCPIDPMDGPVSEECGIWLDKYADNDNTNPGTQVAPVGTLQRAIDLAQAGPGRVFACGGQGWHEPVIIPGNVSLYGGFDCENGWAYVGSNKRTYMFTAAGQIGLTWVSSGPDWTDEAYLMDFHVEAADADTPGGSSIAIFVRDKMTLTFQRCEAIAGDGRDGLDGEPANARFEFAATGEPGDKGWKACYAPVSQGGEAVENRCEGMSKGGAGGDSSLTIAESGSPGEPAATGGKGGFGEGEAPSCTNGEAGAVGSDGKNGKGAKGPPRLAESGYLGGTGEDGAPGEPGGGGGGGGARFGSVAACGTTNTGGSVGGSGGAGGCGGQGGKGGQPGGASIAIATRGRVNFPRDNYAKSGNGGKGGNGGAPQLGGAGGLPGPGGEGFGSIMPGCAGGTGGKGGKGGWGGGGLGGTSVPIAVVGSTTFLASGGIMLTGEPGTGGDGESPKNLEERGDLGESGLLGVLDP